MRKLSPSSPLWLAARQILDKKSTDFFKHLSKALTTIGHEDIHDLRVSTRRLREAVNMFNECYPRKKLKKVARGAKQATRLLGDIRNLDELCLFLEELGCGNRADIAGEELESYFSSYENRRKEVIGDLKEKLEDFHSGKMKAQFAKIIAFPYLINNPDYSCDPFTPFGDFAAKTIDSGIAPVLNLIAPAMNEPDIEAQHRLRIAVKHFRYRTEMLRPLIGRGYKKLYETLKKYQTILGKLHDMDIFAGMIPAENFSTQAMNSILDAIAVRRNGLFKEFMNLAQESPLEGVAGRIRSVLAK